MHIYAAWARLICVYSDQGDGECEIVSVYVNLRIKMICVSVRVSKRLLHNYKVPTEHFLSFRIRRLTFFGHRKIRQ